MTKVYVAIDNKDFDDDEDHDHISENEYLLQRLTEGEGRFYGNMEELLFGEGSAADVYVLDVVDYGLIKDNPKFLSTMPKTTKKPKAKK
ncbi:MAG: hypothetical protein WA061_02665 [Microgenomates group bacterium]